MTENERVRYLRTEIFKLSQIEFAQKIGISHASLSEIEGVSKDVNMRAKTLKGIKSAFNININWLLTGEGEIFQNDEGYSNFIVQEAQAEYGTKNSNIEKARRHLESIEFNARLVKDYLNRIGEEQEDKPEKPLKLIGKKSDKSRTDGK